MTASLHVQGIGAVDLSYSERGTGASVLLLHGGAGPISVVPWGELLARTHSARVLTPTHPGFGGTPRPETLSSVAGLARVYAAFLAQLDLENVTVIGSSVGGWIAAELALTAPALLRSLVLVDAGGIEVPGHPVADVFSLSLEELSRLSYHNPERFRIDPSKFPPQQQAIFAGNRAALKVYGGSMMDPTLRERLSRVDVPTLVAWGESDRVIDVEYGRAYARAIPGAEFRLVPAAGHLPQVEAPEELDRIVWPFVEAHASPRGGSSTR
jgi:pimeloyl-ACP methyl ester carboxylesterase